MKEKRRFLACRADDVEPGGRLIVDIDGKSIGVFNVRGSFYALHNRCPHKGGALCAGPVTGTNVAADGFDYDYGLGGRVIRCSWHGWEFELASGRSLVDSAIRAKTFPTVVDDGDVYVLV